MVGFSNRNRLLAYQGQYIPADTRYPSETKEQDRPTPSPESGHSAVQAPVREQEQPVPAQALREQVPVPVQDYSAQSQQV